VAKALGCPNVSKGYEWLHKSAHSYNPHVNVQGAGGGRTSIHVQDARNFVLGTEQANTEMLLWETHVKRLVLGGDGIASADVTITTKPLDPSSSKYWWMLDPAAPDNMKYEVVFKDAQKKTVKSIELILNVFSTRKPTWAEREINRLWTNANLMAEDVDADDDGTDQKEDEDSDDNKPGPDGKRPSDDPLSGRAPKSARLTNAFGPSTSTS